MAIPGLLQQALANPILIKAVLILSSPFIFLLTTYFFLVPNAIKDPRRRKLPPGPKGLPFVGNMFDLADTEAVRGKVIQWHKQHGDIFHTKIGATDYIWLSSPRVVKDLMDKKSSIYSSRSLAPLAQDVASAGRRQLFMPYGERWRGIRKHTHALLNLTTSVKYQPVQDFESKQLLTEFLDCPSSFYLQNRRYSASVIMLVTYGYRIPSFEDPLIKKIYDVIDNFTEMTAPGAHAIDSFPSLAWLPERLLGNWRTIGKQVFEHDSKIYMDLWNRLKRETDNGEARDCFTKTFYLNDPKKNGIDDLSAAYTCGGMIEAGSETTGTTLNNFMLCMTLFPEAQKKAQEELDRVIGSDRLPTWEDEKNLPYVRSLIKEVLRWRPVNKFGMPHATSEDDWYNGYFIPKGSVAVLNWWAIHRDPKLWDNPDDFEPARYLDRCLPAADYMNIADPSMRDHFTYGAGRRSCPGIHVAERSLYINISRVLWGFNISKKKGPDGAVIEPNQAMVRGFMSVPEPFDCDIMPRSAKHAQIIREEFAKAEKEGINF